MALYSTRSGQKIWCPLLVKISKYDGQKVKWVAFLLHKISSGRFDGLWWMKIGLEHLLGPYMPPYQLDFPELNRRFWPSMAFVAFVWPFGRIFSNSKLMFCYMLKDLPLICGFKASYLVYAKSSSHSGKTELML